MLIPLVVSFAIVAALALVWRRLLKARRALEAARQESCLPHDCPDSAFTVGAPAHPMELTGSRGLWVFDGLFCERCGRELGCARCGKVPAFGEIVEEKSLADAVACCERPMYRVRPGGRTVGPDPSGPPEPPAPKKKWLN